MGYFVQGIKISVVACAVPKNQYAITEYAADLLTEKLAKRIIRGTGFSSLRITDDSTTTSDLCVAAAERLFVDTGIDRKSIGALVFVTQTPDYIMPATSHVIQDRLGLRNDILCLDINEGCSGYITGVYTAGVLANNLQKRVCLLTGDTQSKLTLPSDRSLRCILGDAGTATIIEPGNQDVGFSFVSYGDRKDTLIMENSRHRLKANPVNEGKLFMDGMGVMNFTLNEVPKIMQETVKAQGITLQDISLFACHQPNKLILESIAEKLQVDVEKVPFETGEYGNLASASIPMMLTLGDKKDFSNVMCCGFGVGLAAGAFIYDFTDTQFCGVSEL